MSSPPIPLIAPPENPPPIFFTTGLKGLESSSKAKPNTNAKSKTAPESEAPPAPSSLRLLIIGAPQSGKLQLLKELTGSLPSLPPLPPSDSTETISHAGLSHTWHLKNAYYNLNIPIWIDEFGAADLDTWKRDFLSEEAKEVREVLGGVIFVFREDRNVEDVKKEVDVLRALVGKLGWDWGGGGEGVAFAVKMPRRRVEPSTKNDTQEEKKDADKENEGKEEDGPSDEKEEKVESTEPNNDTKEGKMIAEIADWKELLSPDEGGYEVLDFTETDRDDYGDTTGLERLREGLEANDWSGSVFAPGINGIDDDELGLDGEDSDDGFDEKIMMEEMASFRKGLLGGEKVFEEMTEEEQEGEIEKFEAMVLRLQGLKVKGGSKAGGAGGRSG